MLTLLGQFDIPFARRVAITMHLYEIAFEHLPYSVFNDREQVYAINPLVTVPSLILPNNEVLIDSGAIIDYLDGVVGHERALTPASGEARRKVQNLVALALVACEKINHLHREMVNHPPHQQSPELMQRFRLQIQECYLLLEKALPGDWFVEGRMTQADITVAVMLDFATEHGERLACRPQKPLRKLESLLQRCEMLPAFEKTQAV